VQAFRRRSVHIALVLHASHITLVLHVIHLALVLHTGLVVHFLVTLHSLGIGRHGFFARLSARLFLINILVSRLRGKHSA
jgi:hypothetical protein